MTDERKPFNWLPLAGVIVTVAGMILSAMFWVNTRIVELNTKMDAIQKADYKADMRELKSDYQKMINDFKADQRERDKAQWEAIARKR